jgi:hypothetical protein
MPRPSNRSRRKKLYALGHAELAQLTMKLEDEAHRLQSQLQTQNAIIKKLKECSDFVNTTNLERRVEAELYKAKLAEIQDRSDYWMGKYKELLREKFGGRSNGERAGNGSGGDARGPCDVPLRSNGH